MSQEPVAEIALESLPVDFYISLGQLVQVVLDRLQREVNTFMLSEQVLDADSQLPPATPEHSQDFFVD